MSNLTVAGKVKDWCVNCQNCHTIKKTDSGMEYICSDPYDGMEKTLNGDSNVTCSMYEARPNPTHVCYEPEEKVVKPGEKVDIPEPWWKDKEACTKISLEMDRLRRENHQLEKEKVDHMKGIERLKKSQEKLKNEIKNLHVLVESSHEREDELEKEVKDSKEQIKQLQHEILYLDKYKICSSVENLELKEKNDELNSIIEELKNENKELRSLNEKQYDMLQDMTSQISELIKQRDSWKADYNRLNDYFLKPICEIVYGDANDDIDSYTGLVNRIKDLNSKVEKLEHDKKLAKIVSIHNAELKQTIEDQDMTIKALLITIKEMCKDE